LNQIPAYELPLPKGKGAMKEMEKKMSTLNTQSHQTIFATGYFKGFDASSEIGTHHNYAQALQGKNNKQIQTCVVERR